MPAASRGRPYPIRPRGNHQLPRLEALAAADPCRLVLRLVLVHGLVPLLAVPTPPHNPLADVRSVIFGRKIHRICTTSTLMRFLGSTSSNRWFVSAPASSFWSRGVHRRLSSRHWALNWTATSSKMIKRGNLKVVSLERA